MLVLQKKDRNLLVQSDALGRHVWLAELLANRTGLDESVLTEFPERANFFRDSIPELVAEAKKEWKAENRGQPTDAGNDRSRWEKCVLCGAGIRSVCSITNTLNGNRLTIGPECVEEYVSDAPPTISKAEARNRARRGRLREELHEEIPGLDDTLRKWLPQLQTYPVIIPDRLSIPYRNLREGISSLQRAFLDEEGDETPEARKKRVVSGIRALLAKQAPHLASFDRYCLEVAGDPLAANRGIAEWLRRNEDRKTLTLLAAEGRVSVVTAPRIREAAFMGYVGSRFGELMAPELGVVLEKVDSPNGYLFHIRKVPDVRLLADHQALLSQTGLPGQPLRVCNLRTLLAASSLADGNSRGLVVKALIPKLRALGLSIQAYNIGFNELVVFNTYERLYVIVSDLETITDRGCLLLYADDADTLGDLMDRLTLKKLRRYTRGELGELDRYSHLVGRKKGAG